MIPPTIPSGEQARLATLRAYDVMDTPPEQVFDDLVLLASHIMETPVALISLVDRDRQWFKANLGCQVNETPREHSFCGHVVAGGVPLVVEDALEDPRFHDNPLVTGDPPVRFYAGMPLITGDGHTLGTLCTIDHQPRSVTQHQLALLKRLAGMAMDLLDLRLISRKLTDERESAREHSGSLAAANRVLSLQFEQLTHVLDTLETGVIVADREGVITFASSWMGTQLNLSPVALIGRSIMELPFEPRAALSQLYQEHQRMGTSGKGRVRGSGETEARDFEVSLEKHRGTDDYLWLFHDITEYCLRESDPLGAGSGLLGNSEAIWQVRRSLQELARGTWPVLIQGETGTGKELAARAIHDLSPRHAHPFVAINCAGLTESILTSQLFGHRKGSFTGAVKDQPGLFEAAHGGTLFLDEVGDMPLSVQALILRALETGEVLRVGDTQPIMVDVRIIAATNKDLHALQKSFAFRQDLYYRLHVGRINMPPLRERRRDIVMLFSFFLEQTLRTLERPRFRMGKEALRAIEEYSWPGNVRELKHVVEYVAIHCHSDVATSVDLPPELFATAASHSVTVKKEIPCAQVAEALMKTGGNRSEAAEILGVSRSTLYRWIRMCGTK